MILVDAGTDSDPNPPGRLDSRTPVAGAADAGGALATRRAARDGVRRLPRQTGAPFDADRTHPEPARAGLCAAISAAATRRERAASGRHGAHGHIQEFAQDPAGGRQPDQRAAHARVAAPPRPHRGRSHLRRSRREGDADRIRVRHHPDGHPHARHGRDRGDARDPRLRNRDGAATHADRGADRRRAGNRQAGLQRRGHGWFPDQTRRPRTAG